MFYKPEVWVASYTTECQEWNKREKNGSNCMEFERTLCLNPHEIFSENIREDLRDSRDSK